MYRIGKEELEAVTRVMESGYLFKINNGLQEAMTAEKEMCEIFGSKHSIFLTSGYGALTSALVAMGIGPGDEVIVPAFTYIATAMSVVAAGAMPVIAEIDETLTISPKDIEKKISKHTKAILPVHILGCPCDMDAIMAIAEKYGLFVLEDACQSVGGKYHGKRLGAIGTAGAFSFNYFKLISCGEGGALLTNDRDLFEKAFIYQDSSAIEFFGDQMKGIETKLFCGDEYRSNELAAAILRVQLRRMDGILDDLRAVRDYMYNGISDLCEMLPCHDPDGECAVKLALRFDSEEKARAFKKAEGVKGVVTLDIDKNVYRTWKAIMNKRGALNPLMDPFKMEANKDIVPDYQPDMCPESLDILARTVYIDLNPDWTREIMDERIGYMRKALLSI